MTVLLQTAKYKKNPRNFGDLSVFFLLRPLTSLALLVQAVTKEK